MESTDQDVDNHSLKLCEKNFEKYFKVNFVKKNFKVNFFENFLSQF